MVDPTLAGSRILPMVGVRLELGPDSKKCSNGTSTKARFMKKPFSLSFMAYNAAGWW